MCIRDSLKEVVLKRLQILFQECLVLVIVPARVDGRCGNGEEYRAQTKSQRCEMCIRDRLYEDYVLGNLNQDRYRKMSADYEAEQERIKLESEVIEEWVELYSYAFTVFSRIKVRKRRTVCMGLLCTSASLTTAYASGRISSKVSPFARRSLNSCVLPLSSSSESRCV